MMKFTPFPIDDIALGFYLGHTALHPSKFLPTGDLPVFRLNAFGLIVLTASLASGRVIDLGPASQDFDLTNNVFFSSTIGRLNSDGTRYLYQRATEGGNPYHGIIDIRTDQFVPIVPLDIASPVGVTGTGPTIKSTIRDITNDFKVAVGKGEGGMPFRWTAEEGAKPLTGRWGETIRGEAQKVSSDGSVVWGLDQTNGGFFRWSETDGLTYPFPSVWPPSSGNGFLGDDLAFMSREQTFALFQNGFQWVAGEGFSLSVNESGLRDIASAVTLGDEHYAIFFATTAQFRGKSILGSPTGRREIDGSLVAINSEGTRGLQIPFIDVTGPNVPPAFNYWRENGDLTLFRDLVPELKIYSRFPYVVPLRLSGDGNSILGYYFSEGGERRLFVVRVPEASSLVLMGGLALIGLVVDLKRRFRTKGPSKPIISASLVAFVASFCFFPGQSTASVIDLGPIYGTNVIKRGQLTNVRVNKDGTKLMFARYVDDRRSEWVGIHDVQTGSFIPVVPAVTQINDVSDDWSAVVGDVGARAFVWRQNDGLQLYPMSGDRLFSSADFVSKDGKVVWGRDILGNFRWSGVSNVTYPFPDRASTSSGVKSIRDARIEYMSENGDYGIFLNPRDSIYEWIPKLGLRPIDAPLPMSSQSLIVSDDGSKLIVLGANPKIIQSNGGVIALPSGIIFISDSGDKWLALRNNSYFWEGPEGTIELGPIFNSLAAAYNLPFAGTVLGLSGDGNWVFGDYFTRTSSTFESRGFLIDISSLLAQRKFAIATTVPEASSLFLAGSGLLSVWISRWRFLKHLKPSST
jgi:hypothetical protein